MYNLHDCLADELCNNKSLSALTYLLEKGREFEFTHKGVICFISRSETLKYIFAADCWMKGCLMKMEKKSLSWGLVEEEDIMLKVFQPI